MSTQAIKFLHKKRITFEIIKHRHELQFLFYFLCYIQMLALYSSEAC